ncbi:hypothetical protein HNY73_009016 [Argiope bruennichi]|uniref:Uncharacterized protein n=1 Tax=Argiope bruennichi TaxID=94029 RepID=A0A8T0FAY0_ARGBR|nr:hypothetical protein HNY73_009016 [Argiope bruennichi]
MPVVTALMVACVSILHFAVSNLCQDVLSGGQRKIWTACNFLFFLYCTYWYRELSPEIYACLYIMFTLGIFISIFALYRIREELSLFQKRFIVAILFVTLLIETLTLDNYYDFGLCGFEFCQKIHVLDQTESETFDRSDTPICANFGK